jgi:hypothetical protein
VSTQEKIVAKVEVLFFAMVGNVVWKPRLQPAQVINFLSCKQVVHVFLL